MSEVKQLSGMKSADVNLSDQISVEGFRSFNPQEQANIINTAILAPLDEYKLLEPLDHLPLEDLPIFLEVTEERVQQALAN